MSAISIDQRGFANELRVCESKFRIREQEQQAGYTVNFERLVSVLTVIVAFVMIVSTDNAVAQGASTPAYPCQDREKFSEFDFWIGDWEVHVAGGRLAGQNRIERAQKGCVLLENWTGTSGGTGMSINYLDKTTDEWVQIWNSEGGSQINIRGGLTGEGMLLVGNIHYVGNGTTAPFRGLWTLLPDGRVRQFFEQSNDGGKTWVPWFEGFYTRTGGIK